MDTSKIELKPCPFCGGEAVIRTHMGVTYISPIHREKCLGVDTWLKSDLPLKKQVKLWNRRASE